MQLQLPFEAALVLHRTGLRSDHQDVWRRYEEKTVIRFGRNAWRAVAQTDLGCHDMRTIRNHFELWLASHDAEQDADMCKAAKRAVGILTQAIATAAIVDSCH